MDNGSISIEALAEIDKACGDKLRHKHADGSPVLPATEYESLEQPRIDGKVLVDDFASDNTHDLSSIGTIEDRAQQW